MVALGQSLFVCPAIIHVPPTRSVIVRLSSNSTTNYHDEMLHKCSQHSNCVWLKYLIEMSEDKLHVEIEQNRREPLPFSLLQIMTEKMCLHYIRM